MEAIDGIIVILIFGAGMCVASIIWVSELIIWALSISLKYQKEKIRCKKVEESEPK